MEGKLDGFQHMINVKSETNEPEMFQDTSEKLKVYELESDWIPQSMFQEENSYDWRWLVYVLRRKGCQELLLLNQDKDNVKWGKLMVFEMSSG